MPLAASPRSSSKIARELTRAIHSATQSSTRNKHLILPGDPPQIRHAIPIRRKDTRQRQRSCCIVRSFCPSLALSTRHVRNEHAVIHHARDAAAILAPCERRGHAPRIPCDLCRLSSIRRNAPKLHDARVVAHQHRDLRPLRVAPQPVPWAGQSRIFPLARVREPPLDGPLWWLRLRRSRAFKVTVAGDRHVVGNIDDKCFEQVCAVWRDHFSLKRDCSFLSGSIWLEISIRSDPCFFCRA